MQIQELLQKHFGYSEFKPMQENIINDVVSGKDVFVLMPTGGGKSLCYQIPALINHGVTVVISPLISLMKDQVDSLNANGIGASFINSTLSPAEIEDVKARLLENKDKIVYIAPERLSSQNFIEFLKMIKINLFAIDEAHCISEWGHDFRPDYRKLSLIKTIFPTVPIIALTATAIESVQKDIVHHLKLSNPKIYKVSFDRQNLSYYVRPKEDAYDQIVKYIRNKSKESGIIYCHSRKSAESLSEKLQKDGFRAQPYHAGMSPDERSDNQDMFIRDNIEIIVATIAFGMGINKTNVRYVIHYDLPKTIESYYQEIGRAGRDGLESDCILFFSYGDKIKIEILIEKRRNPEKKQIAYKKLQDMINFCDGTDCRRKMLLEYFGESYEGRCGKCDTCLQPREKMNGNEIAKKAIYCIDELGQRFGMNYVVSILVGKNEKRLKNNRHDKLKSYGAGKNYTAKQWQSFIRELVRNGFLDVIGSKYPVLKLNQKSREVMWNKISVALTKSGKTEKMIVEKKVTRKINDELFEILRSLRKIIADTEKIPPYIVFPDTTLKEMSTYYPHNEEELKKIHGVGEVKIEKYGKIFLERIIAYCKVRNIDPSSM